MEHIHIYWWDLMDSDGSHDEPPELYGAPPPIIHTNMNLYEIHVVIA